MLLVLKGIDDPVSRVRCRATTGKDGDNVDVSSYEMAFYESPDVRIPNVEISRTAEALIFVKNLCRYVREKHLCEGEVVFFGPTILKAVLDKKNYQNQNHYGVFVMTRVNGVEY